MKDDEITMATIKSYTDIQQSKKLAEILPLESADMCFNTHNNMPPLMTPYSRFKEFFNMEPTPAFLIPCWSLSALLNVLPSSTLDSSDNHRYRFRCMERYTEWYDNAIDVCVAMIGKLNKLNLL